jgi:excisionase family DNA binding protein
MDLSLGQPEPIFASEQDIQTLKRLEELLTQDHPMLVGRAGEEILLPESVYQVLRQVTHFMAEGKAISLIPHDHYLSSQEAANLLNVSRPYLYTLLDQHQIPFIKVGSHRRIRFEDLMLYKQNRDNQRHQSLGALTALSQELGFYELANSDQGKSDLLS